MEYMSYFKNAPKVTPKSKTKDKHNMFIEKLFYEYEIELLTKMCSRCLQDDYFSETEKQNINNILENTLT